MIASGTGSDLPTPVVTGQHRKWANLCTFSHFFHLEPIWKVVEACLAGFGNLPARASAPVGIPTLAVAAPLLRVVTF